jgi:hypothetical protein
MSLRFRVDESWEIRHPPPCWTSQFIDVAEIPTSASTLHVHITRRLMEKSTTLGIARNSVERSSSHPEVVTGHDETS